MGLYRFPVERRRRAVEEVERVPFRRVPPPEDLAPVQGLAASDLERRTYRALLRLGWTDDRIIFQSEFFGGRKIAGGQVVDFIVLSYPDRTLIRVQGEYWHGGAEAQARDAFGFARLVNAGEHVEDIYWWELTSDDQAYDTVQRKVGSP